MSTTAPSTTRPASAGPWARVVGTFRTALLLVLAVSGAATVAVGAVGLVQTQRVATHTDALYADGLAPVQDLALVREKIWYSRWASLSNLTASDAETADKYSALTKEGLAAVQTGLDQLATRTLTATGQQARATLVTEWETYLEYRETSAALKKSGDLVAWQEYRSSTLNPQITKVVDALGTLAEAADARAAELRDEADAARGAAQVMIMVIGVGGLFAATALGLLIAGQVSRRLAGLSSTLTRAAAGDLTVHAPGVDDTELGRMAAAVDHLVTHMRAALGVISGTSGVLMARAEDLRGASDTLTSASSSTNERVSSIDSGLMEVTESVHSVATGAQEMGTSIREISVNASDAASVAREAVEAANSAQELMTRLGAASEEIGNVVKLITSIAEQTNLLALNATIEAARAGDAGKGFAVVADEVKQLAQETARATDDIAGKVTTIQSETGQAITAISAVGDVISRISDYQATIAAAVEEQSAVTEGMAHSLQRASEGAQTVKSGMQQVVQDASMQGQAAQSARGAAEDLTDASSQLSDAVGTFKI